MSTFSFDPSRPAPPAPDPEHALTPTGNLRRRLIVNRVVESGTVLAAAIAIFVLGLIIVSVASHGLHVISWKFITSDDPMLGAATGGMGPALVGTGIIVALSLIFAMPVGLLVALYTTEFAGPRAAQTLKLFIEMMNGLPSVLVGVFIYALIVINFKQSAIAGGIANAIVVMPLVSRSCIEALGRVPATYREAADALGVARWRSIIGIIIPTASGGILTSAILAGARAAGETAPLLFTCWVTVGYGLLVNPLHPVPTVPQQIFTLIETGSPVSFDQAWGAAFLLLIFILAANFGARAMLRRFEKKRGL